MGAVRFPRVVLGLPGWVSSHKGRGISVVRDVCREEATAVLEEHAEKGGVIYNARQRSDPTGGEI
jgi:hypothetical protein